MAGTTSKRLTRDEKRAQTRARILEAAEELFVELGFNGTSVEEIAERAGYTRGAFYSNFEDKDDVFLSVLDDHLARRVEEVSRALHSSPSLDAAFELIQRGNRGREISRWSILQTEFWLYAMRNPGVRPRLAQRQRAERLAYERAITAQFDAVGLAPPGPLHDLALILQILDEGAPRQRAIDPQQVRSEFFFDAVLMLFEAGVALARERERETKRASKP